MLHNGMYLNDFKTSEIDRFKMNESYKKLAAKTTAELTYGNKTKFVQINTIIHQNQTKAMILYI